MLWLYFVSLYSLVRNKRCYAVKRNRPNASDCRRLATPLLHVTFSTMLGWVLITVWHLLTTSFNIYHTQNRVEVECVSKWVRRGFRRAIQCEPKNAVFWNFFPRLGIFNQFFTHLLHDPFYTRLQTFIQISPTFTKLCHTKRIFTFH